MENRYVGDVGDFGKYGLLKAILNQGFKVGVNWYLMASDDSNDGKHINYLNQSGYRNCDPELFDNLKKIVISDNRNVEQIRNKNIIGKDVIFFDKEMKIPKSKSIKEKRQYRTAWHNEAIDLLCDSCEVVFLDPDNGIESKSTSIYSTSKRNGGKYVAVEEIKDYLSHGKSVIVYNHRDRSSKDVYYNRFKKISENLEIRSDEVFILSYHRGTARDYVFFCNKEHKLKLLLACEKIMDSSWRKHFDLLYLS